MFRKTFTGSLVAASLTAGALMTMPAASAAPTYIDSSSPSTVGNVPSNARIAMSENGTAIASWIRDVSGQNRVQASVFSNGSWSAPANVSPQNAVVANPNVAINDKGVAVAAWMQKDENNHFQIQANRFTAGAFGASKQVSVGTSYDATGEMDVAVDGNGKFWAAYQVTDNGALNQVRVLRDNGAGAYGAQYSSLSDSTSFAPDIAVNNAGQAVLAWYNAGNGSSTIDVRRFNSSNGTWTAAKSIGNAGQIKVESEATLNDAGVATVGYVKQDLDNDYRASVARIKTDGNVTGNTYVSPAGVTTEHISLDQNDSGAAVLAWSQENTEVGYRTRAYETAGWASGSAVNANLAGTTYPKAAISDTGSYMIGWAEGGNLHGRYRGSSVLPFVQYNSAGVAFKNNETSVGIDNKGNALVGGVYNLPDPTQGALHVKFLDASGPTSTLANVPANTLTGKVALQWSAKDRFSEVGLYDVRVRTTAWNSVNGVYTSLLTGSPATSLDFIAKPGRTYCFEVRSRDVHANYGAFTAPKCTTTPVDDRAGVIAKGFKRAKASTSYLGTYSIAKKKNAVMSFQHVKAKRIAILVTKVAAGGKVKVTFGGQTIGTYSLKGSGNKKYIAVKTFSKVKTGTLVIKVVSPNGKVVRIDGIVIAK